MIKNEENKSDYVSNFEIRFHGEFHTKRFVGKE